MTTSADAPLDLARVRDGLRGLALGQPLHYFPALPSTNTHAMTLARAGAPEGTLVLTDAQTAGKGRLGRTWLAEPRQGLALSLVLRPQVPPHALVLAAAVAVATAIEETTGLDCALKWPNDVLVSGRKVCGILIETSDDVAVLGIGINANGSLASAPELTARATTLAQAAGQTVDREALLLALLRLLDGWYTRLHAEGQAALGALHSTWRARLATLGQPVRIVQGSEVIEGVAEDVDDHGALLVRTAVGRLRAILWGDVEQPRATDAGLTGSVD